MPNRDPIETEERLGKGAQPRGKRDDWQAKDSTSVSHGTEANGNPGRKSPWTRLADALADPDAGPDLRAVLEAGRNVKAEPGDGVAAFLPGGETLLLLVESDGLLVRRNVTDEEVHLFLSRGEVAA